MSEEISGYQAIRRVLENLVANYPCDRPIAAYVAACYYLSEHCEDCGARLSDHVLSVGNEGVQGSSGMADALGEERTICANCLAWRRQAVV